MSVTEMYRGRNERSRNVVLRYIHTGNKNMLRHSKLPGTRFRDLHAINKRWRQIIQLAKLGHLNVPIKDLIHSVRVKNRDFADESSAAAAVVNQAPGMYI